MHRETMRRVYKLDEMIRFGKLRSAGLAARELEVTRRTIERDLEFMRAELHADIEYDHARGTYHYAGNAITLPAQWLSEQELAIMLVAEKALRMYTDTSFCDSIHPAFNHLLTPIRGHAETMEHIREFCGRVCFHRSHEPIRGLRHEFTVVLDAIMQRRRLAMQYLGAGSAKPSPREIEPYVLINNDGDWQVVGYCRQSHRVKTFALDRIHRPAVTDRPFVIPDSFRSEEYCRHAFERLDGEGSSRICIEVDPDTAGWVREKLWHRTQKLTELPGGGLRIEMSCAPTEALVAWILRMGPGAEVLAPKALRETVARRAAAIAQRYTRS